MINTGETGFAPGDLVGAYKLIKRIGAGGMGEVFEGVHRHIGRHAAIKVLLPELSVSEVAVTRFFNEARAASLIRHPGIVEILDCDIHPATGRAYIVMELLQGESLGTHLRRAVSFSTNMGWVGAVCGQIAEALGAAHAKSITHRDLKPDNVVLAAAGEASGLLTVKVLDFGVAKLYAEGLSNVSSTHPGSILGTPLYMSPEQCRGAGVDRRADIYSLGCMIFELVVGRPPFERKTAVDLIVAHLSEPPPDLAVSAAGVPAGLSQLVRSMLAKNPAERPPHMSAVVQQMELLLGVRAAQFGRLIQRPENLGPELRLQSVQALLPGRVDDGHASVSAGRAVGSSVRGIAPLEVRATPGSTMVLPVQGQTTLGLAASESLVDMPVTLPRRRARWVLLVAGSMLVTAILVLSLRRSGLERMVASLPPSAWAPPSAISPAPPPEPAPPPAPSTAPSPAEVTVDLSSNPSGAEVWVSGESTFRGITPLILVFPPSGAPRQLILKSKDHVSKTVSLDGTQNGRLLVQLEKQTPERKSTPPTRGKKAANAYVPVGD